MNGTYLLPVSRYCILLRAELLLLFGPLLLWEMFRGRLTISRLLLSGIPAGIGSIGESAVRSPPLPRSSVSLGHPCTVLLIITSHACFHFYCFISSIRDY